MTNSSTRLTMDEIINGIQQIGIGVSDTKSVFNWYREYLGFDILLFKDVATATLMSKYTDGAPQRRDAYLSLNLRGGGGLEIWQFKDRIPTAPKAPILWGDLGINAMKLRTADIQQSHRNIAKLSLNYFSEIKNLDTETPSFYFDDPWQNRVEVVQDAYSFSKTRCGAGGVLGAVIGVSNMEASIIFYKDLLGYAIISSDEIVEIAMSKDSKQIGRFRKVILIHKRDKFGGFGELLGPTQIELIQALDRTPEKIYKNRFWGDLGYIHICFDVHGMDALREKASRMNHPFTVDSSQSFDMGDAAGHFSYVEDPDNTLIEFVETHKVPILKSLGWNIDLKKRNPLKPLPRWLIKAMKVHRVKKDV